MKILYITNHLNGNDGWSRYSVDIIREIIKNGDNEILCLVNRFSEIDKSYEKRILESPLNYLSNPLRSVLIAKHINKIIKGFSPDIIHFMVEPYITILPFLKIKKRTKIILTIHGTYSYFPNLINNIFKRIISSYLYKKSVFKIDKIISVSKFTRAHLLKNINNEKLKNFIDKKITVITNGINLENINFGKRKRKDKNERKNILFVGAIKPRKGMLESIEALKYYVDNFSDNFIYNVVGDYNENDIYYKKIMQKIKEYNLDNKILFKGKVSNKDLEKYYEEADLFLMLSINDGKKFEGFGLVFLEASARGIPCVGSNGSGAEEAILNEESGFNVNPFNKKEVAEKINLILNKNVISQKDCFLWAQKNNIRKKIEGLLFLYLQ